MQLMAAIRSKAGFTLVEMSIVLLVTGLIIASSASYYRLYQKREDAKETALNISAVTGKIAQFRNINGRYPAPASMTLLRGDPNYGRENATVCKNAAKLPGTCENGVCIKSNTRDTNNDGVNETLRVCMGTIPFRQLSLPEEYAFDGHGNRLVYAVTEDMTDDVRFSANIGGIDILKAAGTVSALNVPSSAHFVVISPGPNRAGGFTSDGVQLPCPAAGPESTNCNTAAPAVFRVAQVNESAGNAQFDDTVNYFIKDPVPLWQISPDATAKQQGDMIMKPGDSLGTKILSTNTTEVMPNKMVVNGVMRSTEKVVSGQLCNGVGTDCFSPSLLAGPLGAPNDNSGLKCPDDDPDGAGKYMVAIEHGYPVCEDEVAAVCPPGQVMNGVQPSGQIRCETFVPTATPPNYCPSFQTTICGRTYTVPSIGAAGTVPWPEPVTTVYDTGGTGGAWQYWYCNGNVEWSLTDSNESPDICAECVPVAEEFRNFGCGDGFSGDTAIYRISLSCPGYAISFLDAVNGWQGPPVSSNCVCIAETQTETFDCPGYTGTYVGTRVHNCDSYDAANHTGDYWTAWDHSAAASCPCTPGPVTDSQPCPNGNGGWMQLEGTRTCPGADVPDWHVVDDSECTAGPACNPSETEDSSPQACPQGYTANPVGIVNRRQRDCTTGGWHDWQPHINDCVAGAPTSYKWGGGTPLNSTPGSALSTNKRGTTCTYGTASSPCYEGSSSAAINYANCICGE